MESGSLHLALDAHGGDHGPLVTVAAACDALTHDPGLSITLTGLPEQIEPVLERHACERLRFEPCETVLDGDARPVAIIRQGVRSSLGKAMDMVASGNAQACVSAGSTVALMTLGVKLIGMLNGIRRPALMSRIPARHGFTNVLDLGANLNVDATQLVQFAIMGAVVCAREGLDDPRIGLLNVGHEETKGHAVVREAHDMLGRLPLDYHGFIEGDDIFAGRVDVAVCDGFSGNLLLKSAEGLARMLFSELGDALKSGWRARLGSWMARRSLEDLLARFDPAEHNGAPLLGLRGVVVKSHGGADREAMLKAILEAGQEAGKHVPERIEELIHNYKAEAES
ncbi:MAG: phosphate acyltransferase PlsX [Xanthomonadales bacterium]|nr:phosphate acyltransferase PlsX [Xanthomonadales bacterium]NIX11784.1 phosphate acyltransferase PlsX [Xanthomonadales bacterium]